jgi:transmembrane sensor
MQTASEIAAKATAWLIRLEREATPELWEELQQWLDSHPRHRAEFIRQRTAWYRCDKLKILRPTDGTIDADLLSRIEIVEPARATRRHASQPAAGNNTGAAHPSRSGHPGTVDLSRRGWLAAAAVTGLAILGAWYLAFQGGWQTYSTQIGQRQQIALSDGSSVELNTDSVLRVRLNPQRRDLVLTRGEALFHVAHDTSRPFFVSAATTLVRAVGTAFSVRIRTDNSVDVVVTEGRVAFGTPRTDTSGDPVLSASAMPVSADEAAAMTGGRVSRKQIGPDEVARKLAWTDPSGPRLSFQGETLAEEVAEFNRYNVRHLVIADPSIAQIVPGGRFLATDPESFVLALRKSFHVIVGSADTREVRLIHDPDAPASATMPPLQKPAGVSSTDTTPRARESTAR